MHGINLGTLHNSIHKEVLPAELGGTYLPITTSTGPNNSSETKLLVLVTNKSTGLITAFPLSKYV